MAEVTLADIESKASLDPTRWSHYQNLVWAVAPPPYQEWVAAVEAALVQSCQHLSETKDRTQRNDLSDFIDDLTTNLALLGFDARPSHHSLLISLGSYKWIGNGIFDYDFNQAATSFKHLVNDKLNGTDHRRHGGILLFCIAKDASTSFNDWRVAAENAHLLSGWAAGTQQLVATSTASSASSGLPVVVIHIAVAVRIDASHEASANVSSPGQQPSDVVVLVHGIRTHAGWAEMVRNRLMEGGIARVIPIRYGYFDVFRFLFPVLTRRAPIARVLRELRDIRRDNPTSRISVVAHSFGTYAISKALEEREIVFDRIIFCGSIVESNFRRNDYKAQLGPDDILNDCGHNDVWPVLANALTFGFGPTGTVGFGSNGIRDRFHPFAHGDYFAAEFVDAYWVPFLTCGSVNTNPWEAGRPALPIALEILASPLTRYVVAAILTAAILLLLT